MLTVARPHSVGSGRRPVQPDTERRGGAAYREPGHDDPHAANRDPRLQGQPVRDRVAARGAAAAGVPQRGTWRAGPTLPGQHVYGDGRKRPQEPQGHPPAPPRESANGNHRDGLLCDPGSPGRRRAAGRGRRGDRQAAAPGAADPAGTGRTGKGDSPHLPGPTFGRCPPDQPSVGARCLAQRGTGPFSCPGAYRGLAGSTGLMSRCRTAAA